MGKLNILHHKTWHVYSKDNQQIVKDDEKLAEEEEQDKRDKILKAEQEARIRFLREKANIKTKQEASSAGHVNLFEEEERVKDTSLVQSEKDREFKEKSDKHTWFLGETRSRKQKFEDRQRVRLDPMQDILKSSSKSISKSKTKNKTPRKSIEELRMERLEREKREHSRTIDLINPPKNDRHDKDAAYYNSQFNPNLIRKRDN